MQKIKFAYDFIINQKTTDGNLQQKVTNLQYLENELGLDFKDTADFDNKMKKVFIRASGADELRRIREKRGWSQNRLAVNLGVTRPFITMMESGERPLSKKAINFIKGNQI